MSTNNWYGSERKYFSTTNFKFINANSCYQKLKTGFLEKLDITANEKK